MRLRRIRITRRLSTYIDLADIWVGVYIAPSTIYVCPLPCWVFRWVRHK